MATSPDITTAALESRAWPFAEAQKVVERLAGTTPEYALFETGYGPSGLPHLGTFGEVARTTMVLRAFELLSDIPARMICFSDDMDGLRKVPDNIPNALEMAPHLGKPLTEVPDPFGTHESFGAHNNARLRSFLDQFGFEYEFYSSTECYKSGRFDDALRTVLRNYDRILKVILPTLGEERRKTYSPFLPVCPKTGIVLQVPMLEVDADAATVTFEDSEGERQTVSVTGGNVKCQWKVDWGMRWHALGVDYEMSGKDLMESVKLSSTICRILGSKPPEGFTYELFLDENGEKISKSKGNGLTIEEWLRYGTPESLSLYMFQSPRKAKKLSFDVIPRTMDDYRTWVRKYHEQEQVDRFKNPAFHIHGGDPSAEDMPIEFSILLNLVAGAHVEEKDALWGFVSRYLPDASPETHPTLDRMLDHALHYYRDFILPNQQFRPATDTEAEAMRELAVELAKIPEGVEPEQYQTVVYEVGKRYPFDSLRDWFSALYQVLLGQKQGPRMGSFIAVYGRDETIALIAEKVGEA